MKLIANQNLFQSSEEFLKQIARNIDYLEGVLIEVTLTKDGIPVIIIPYTSTTLSAQAIKNIQTTNFNDIKNYDLVTLDNFLNSLGQINNKIVINFVPIPTTQYAQNLELINQINQQQVINLYNILNKYPSLNIYLSSISHAIIRQIKQINSNSKIGVILSAYETNYIDVDFYIFSPEMLSYPILKQQLEFNKEAMISSRGCEEMMIIYNFFNSFSSDMANNIFNSISFISDYPLIIYKLFN